MCGGGGGGGDVCVGGCGACVMCGVCEHRLLERRWRSWRGRRLLRAPSSMSTLPPSLTPPDPSKT